MVTSKPIKLYTYAQNGDNKKKKKKNQTTKPQTSSTFKKKDPLKAIIAKLCVIK